MVSFLTPFSALPALVTSPILAAPPAVSSDQTTSRQLGPSAADPSATRPFLRISNIILLSPDFPLHTFLESSAPLLNGLSRTHGTVVTIYGDRHDRPLGYGEYMNRLFTAVACRPAAWPFPAWRSLGRLHGAPWADETELDADIIDTTWMQAGLPAGDPDLAINTTMRHSHFTVNRLMVEDLAECVITGRRAEQRTSRLQRRDSHTCFRFFTEVDEPAVRVQL